MKYAKIIATGSSLPSKVVTNAELEKTLDTTDEWIQQRTGIKQRYIVDKNESVVTMGAAAAKIAINDAGLQYKDIDMIIVATCTPEKIFPSTACLIQKELDIPICPAFDVQAACSGFIYALSIANQYIRSEQSKRVLVIGTEAMSRIVDWNDRGTCVLFGDGAGAVLLEASDEPGIVSTHMSSDGRFDDVLYLNNATATNDDAFLQMQGSSVFRMAVKWLAQIAGEALSANNLTSNDIDWVIPHQANIRIINSTIKSLGISSDKVVITVDKHANTSGASIPLALDEAIRDGRIKRGQNLLLEAFGGGLTWASALVRY